MFSKLKQLSFAAAVGVATLAAGNTAAIAMPLTSAPQVDNSGIELVQSKRERNRNGYSNWDERRDGRRCRTRTGNCKNYHRGYFYQTPWWVFPVIIGSAIASSNNGNSHVQWCLSRYRSYNPRTDLWLGYSGRYYRCNSPY